LEYGGSDAVLEWDALHVSRNITPNQSYVKP
jgi:hypothetical protein